MKTNQRHVRWPVILLLWAFAIPAFSGPLENAVDRIENKVDDLKATLNQVKNKTNAIEQAQDGLKPMLDTVKGVTGKVDTSTFDDLSENLDFAQDLLTFVKLQGESAGNSGDYVNVGDLVVTLIDISERLIASDAYSSQIDFQVLENLTAILPEKLLAVSGRSLYAAGIDANRLSQLQSLVASLETYNQVEAQERDEQSDGESDKWVGEGWTRCDVYNEARPGLKADAALAVGTGLFALVSGEIIAGLAKTVQTEQEVGIHGYTGMAIETDVSGAIGKVMAGVGRGAIAVGGSIYGKLRHCELLHHARLQDTKHELILENQQNLLREICSVTRYRSEACQAVWP